MPQIIEKLKVIVLLGSFKKKKKHLKVFQNNISVKLGNGPLALQHNYLILGSC